MKKLISLVLTLVMLFAVMAPAASVSATNERTPIIYIRGNGENIYRPDGSIVPARFENLELGGEGSGIDKDTIVETAVNILKPFIIEGMIFDQWDGYGKAIYDEISPLFKDSGLDYDGNPTNGTGISQSLIAESEAISNSSYKFSVNEAYYFRYDWRLSPYDHVERLHTFVQNVMRATGATQVSLYARCLGGSLLSAYVNTYGSEGHIKNVMFSDVLSNESTMISKAFSGQIEFDAKTVERFIGQTEYCDEINYGIGFTLPELLHEIVFESMAFFNQINATDGVLDGVEDLYERLYKALVPALCHAIGFATQINNWSCVAEEDMDAALNLMFGKEGSELRTKYAGLIEKIQYYRSNISSDLKGFYDRAKANGIHIGFIAKYGFVNMPLTKDADLLSDTMVSVEHATMGATCAKVGQTLSDSYIASHDSKYISPDKQIDLSTGFAPDSTWVFKNNHHSLDWASEPIIKAFLNGTNETVESIGMPRFYVVDQKTKACVAMTEDNCADLDFMTLPVEEPTTESIFVAAMRWFTMLFKVIGMLLKGEISFGEAKEIL